MVIEPDILRVYAPEKSTKLLASSPTKVNDPIAFGTSAVMETVVPTVPLVIKTSPASAVSPGYVSEVAPTHVPSVTQRSQFDAVVHSIAPVTLVL